MQFFDLILLILTYLFGLQPYNISQLPCELEPRCPAVQLRVECTPTQTGPLCENGAYYNFDINTLGVIAPSGKFNPAQWTFLDIADYETKVRRAF